MSFLRNAAGVATGVAGVAIVGISLSDKNKAVALKKAVTPQTQNTGDPTTFRKISNTELVFLASLGR